MKANLQSIGSDLAVVLDKPENAIRGVLPFPTFGMALGRSCTSCLGSDSPPDCADLVSGDTTVLATEEICSEEKQVEEQVRHL